MRNEKATPDLARVMQSRVSAQRGYQAATEGVRRKEAELAQAKSAQKEAAQYMQSTEIALRHIQKSRVSSRGNQ